MSGSIVRLEKAAKAFATPEGGRVVALDGIDLDVTHNEFLTLLGPSGCGKTTLLHAISGFVGLDGGRVLIDGSDVTQVPPHRRPVNTVFQNYALFPHMSVDRNVGYSLDINRIPAAERDRRVGAVLEMVGLSGLGGRYPKQLSGGQQQRVALARAIVARPKLLLLDEPLSALDRNLRQSMQIELKALQSELGISFIFVTHDQEEALTMSNRVAVLDRGKVQQIDDPRAVYDHPANSFVAKFIGASNLFVGVFDGSAVHVTGGPTILASPGKKMPSKGERVTALIRPERLRLIDASAGPAATLDATLRQIVFTGLNFHVHGEAPSGGEIMAILPASQQADSLAPGRQVRLAYDPNEVHLITNDSEENGR